MSEPPPVSAVRAVTEEWCRKRLTRMSKESSDSDWKLVQAVIIFTHLAFEPLSAPAMMEALTTTMHSQYFGMSLPVPEVDELLKISDGLVMLNESNCLVLTHSCVGEWMASGLCTTDHNDGTRKQQLPRSAFRDGIDPLAVTCLDFLCLEEFDHDSMRTAQGCEAASKAHPFFNYAVKHWNRHLARSKPHLLSNRVTTLSQSLAWVICVRCYLKEHELDDGVRYSQLASITHFICMFGVTEFFQAYRNTDSFRRDLESEDEYGRSPADYACLNSDKSTCLWLLDQANKLKIPPSNLWKKSSIIRLAIEQGWLEVIELLLSLGWHIDGSVDCVPLICAIDNRQLAIARYLLDAGANIEARDEHGYTAFLAVVATSQTSLRDLLVERGADVKALTSLGQSAIMVAIINRHGGLKACKLLIDLGVNVKQKADELECHQTAIHYASAAKHTEMSAVIELLVRDHGLKVDETNLFGNTPLHMVCRHSNGDIKLCRKLLDLGADREMTNNDGNTPLHLAISYGQLETVRLLLQGHCSSTYLDTINKDGFTALHLAAKENHIEIAKLLLDKGALIDIQHPARDNATALHEAVLFDNEAVALELLGRGANPNLKGLLDSSALLYAAIRGYGNLVDPIIRHGGELNSVSRSKSSALHFSLEVDAANVAQDLIKKYPQLDLNSKNNHGTTPLHLASDRGQLEVVKLLIKHGALSLPNRKRWLPIHEAAHSGHAEVLDVLMEAFGECNALTDAGYTPLMHAALKNHTSVVRKLLKKDGTDIDGRNKHGETALMLAVDAAAEETVHVLLESGADIHQTCHLKRSLVHRAVRGKSVSLTKRLLALGCSSTGADIWGFTALSTALMSGSMEFIDLLQQHEHQDFRQISATGEVTLVAACQSPNLDVVELVCQKLPDISMVDDLGRNAIYRAARSGYHHVVEFLQDRGMEIDPCASHAAETSLASAAGSGYVKVVNALLQTCSSSLVNITTPDGGSPLGNAAWASAPRTVELLLEAGADATRFDCYGWSAWDLARSHKPTLQALCNYLDRVMPNSAEEKQKTVQRTIIKSLECIREIENVRSTKDLVNRLQTLVKLGVCLRLYGDYGDMQEARMLQCYAEVLRPHDLDTYYITWYCSICRKENWVGSYYACVQCPYSELCEDCHKAFVKAGRRCPEAVRELQALEVSVQNLSLVIGKYEDDMITRLAFALRRQTDMVATFRRRLKEYHEWSVRYKEQGEKKLYPNIKRPGQQILEILLDAMNINQFDPSGNKCKDSQPQVESEKAQIIKRFSEWKKDSHWAQEWHNFCCDGHDFLTFDADELKMIRKNQKYFDEDGRLTKGWIDEAHEYYSNLFNVKPSKELVHEHSGTLNEKGIHDLSQKIRRDDWVFVNKREVSADDETRSLASMATLPPYIAPSNETQRPHRSLFCNLFKRLRLPVRLPDMGASAIQFATAGPSLSELEDGSYVPRSSPPPYSSASAPTLTSKATTAASACVLTRDTTIMGKRKLPPKQLKLWYADNEKKSELTKKVWVVDVTSDLPGTIFFEGEDSMQLIRPMQRWSVELLYDATITSQSVEALTLELFNALMPESSLEYYQKWQDSQMKRLKSSGKRKIRWMGKVRQSASQHSL